MAKDQIDLPDVEVVPFRPDSHRWDHRQPTVRKQRESEDGRRFLIASRQWNKNDAANYVNQRRSRYKTYSAPFLGWDGEGYTLRRHRYVMLCNGKGDSIVTPKGLRSRDCLDFLSEAASKYHWHNHVMFGGSYDANMIVGTMGYVTLLRLATTGQTFWMTWYLKYRPRKYLMVSKITNKIPYRMINGKRKLNVTSTITIWDVIGFFQTSFVKTLEGWLPTRTDIIDFIARMKSERGSFDPSRIEEMERYCIEECRLLEDVMSKLREYAKAVGYCPSRWDGAGAMATKMLKTWQVQECMSRKCETDKWNTIRHLARYAYFGGRIQMVQYGMAGPVYSHDLASAYPYAMRDLPCLAHGEWAHMNENELNYYATPSLVLYHVKYTSRNFQTIYPLPWRNKEKLVFFPRETEGWYWQPEVDAMMECNTPKSYEISEAWAFFPRCDHRPFARIQEAYDFRLRLKAARNPAQIAIKLPMNAAYGKIAQQLGGKQGKPPPFHELIWAGMITSTTRAKMYRLAMTKPDAVIAFETDGLYTTEPLEEHTPNGLLGSWTVERHEHIIYVQSGIYFVDGEEGWKAKYRGLDPGILNPQDVLDAWEHKESMIKCQSTRFRGMMTSVMSPERFMTWCQWVTDPREVSLTPQGKSMAVNDQAPWPTKEQPLRRTYALGGGGLSMPHVLKWDDGSDVKTLATEWYLSDMEYDEDGCA